MTTFVIICAALQVVCLVAVAVLFWVTDRRDRRERAAAFDVEVHELLDAG